ncbi:MAG: 4Fe-4S binding protein [Planctomycetes bacterium]|nr:4Fe-4S binding protein [Planctomycetota bacterium]
MLLPSSDVAMSSRLSPATPPTSPRPAAGDPFAPLARAHRFGAWRAGALFSVYVLMVVHILHWQLAGRTLAPLELHEVMYTAELGVVTAGFLFMAGTLLLTAVFGRFFCGWACHLLALQDLSAWLLKKLGIRRKPIRARVIAWAPFVIMFYMFVWPQLERIADGRPHPGFRFAGDEEPIASFTTTNFWRNLPDPWIALLTFVVCGGWIVYVLGSRGFCTHACPYGAAFRLLDRLAPGRIRVDDKCTQCGTCTKVCTSGIQVHDQLRTHGTVIDPRCLKDLDCVGSCPHDALHYGFGAPALFTQRRAGELPRQRAPEFALAVDLFLGIGFLVVLLVYRGLYGTVPFLMSVGLGAGVPYAALVSWRLARSSQVELGRFALKRAGRLTRAGVLFAASSTLLLALTAHSAAVRFSMWRGAAAYAEASSLPAEARGAAAAAAVVWLQRANDLALVATSEAKASLAWARALRGEPLVAKALFAEVVGLEPARADHRYFLAGFQARTGEADLAVTNLRAAVQLAPRWAEAHERLGQLLVQQGDKVGGEAELALARQLASEAADR